MAPDRGDVGDVGDENGLPWLALLPVNVADGRKALLLSAVVILPLFLIFLLVGALLWVFYQTHSFGIPLPEARPGLKANDFIFPIFMMTEVPHVLKGFLIVAILSAAMSSVSSALTSLASVSTMDFVKGQHGQRSENVGEQHVHEPGQRGEHRQCSDRDDEHARAPAQPMHT